MTELIVPQFPADVTYPLITDPTRPAHSLERPTFEMPAGAVDAHIHIFGPLDVYPSVEKPFYSVPDASLEDRKSTRLNSITNAHLVCRLLLEKKKNNN